ncbi:MAG TPA: hypothetical protein VL332_03015 [Candidatus Saccharimonadaceae bacterium]|nr:hypothetical protein [Candidatus Saccharimonadaceae bacterium]
MRAMTSGALLLLATASLAAPDDRRPLETRMVGGASAIQVRLARGIPAFARFGWVSPPAESTTAARIVELAGSGMNLALPAWQDSGRVADNLARLDFAAASGMRALVYDGRFERFLDVSVESPEGQALLDSIAATYRDHPGFAGYYLGDEPPASEFALLGALHRALRARDPDHPAWNNLLPPYAFATRDAWVAYVRAYLDTTGAAVLCDDEYDFLTSGDRGEFVANAATLAELARERGIPFWSIVLVIQHLQYRALTDAELSWQASMLLAYGARGVGFFTYWTPAPDAFFQWQEGLVRWDGTRSHWYATVRDLNAKLAVAGGALSRLTWFVTRHSGSVPAGAAAFAPDAWALAVRGRAALGEFADSAGTRYLLVANADSSSARTIALTVPNAGAVDALDLALDQWNSLTTTPAPSGVTVDVALGPGEFALLRLRGAWSAAPAAASPRLAASPNPATGEVALVLGDVRDQGRIEILDAGGRRVWSRAVAPGSAAFRWRGERDAGGVTRPGLYFVRAEDARGVTVTRLSWLGPAR